MPMLARGWVAMTNAWTDAYSRSVLPAIQSRMRVDATVFLGVYGFKVPAIALQPLAMISCANCLASASVANLRVPRTHLRAPPSGLGKMFER
jgi:hypothetical protein